MLEMQSSSVPEAYMALFPHLLLPILWERPGNIPPLVRLLQAFIEKGASQIDPERVVSLFTSRRICILVKNAFNLLVHTIWNLRR